MKTHTEYLGNGIINIHVSFAVKRRNGRKLIIELLPKIKPWIRGD